MAVVQKGDVIYVLPSSKEAKMVTIEWYQGRQKHTENFLAMPFYVPDNPQVLGSTLFVEEYYRAKFQKLATEIVSPKKFGNFEPKSVYSLTVTDEFQYGQDKAEDPQIRFLVYQNKNNGMFQHRFMSTETSLTIIQSINDKLKTGLYGETGTILGKVAQVVDHIRSLTGAVIGDPMRNFS